MNANDIFKKRIVMFAGREHLYSLWEKRILDIHTKEGREEIRLMIWALMRSEFITSGNEHKETL